MRLPDGNLAYWCGPDFPEETCLAFLDKLRNLQPGVWYTICHRDSNAPPTAIGRALLAGSEGHPPRAATSA